MFLTFVLNVDSPSKGLCFYSHSYIFDLIILCSLSVKLFLKFSLVLSPIRNYLLLVLLVLLVLLILYLQFHTSDLLLSSLINSCSFHKVIY